MAASRFRETSALKSRAFSQRPVSVPCSLEGNYDIACAARKTACRNSGRHAVTTAEMNQAVAAKIVAFLRDVGLEIQTGVLEGETVLPGINVDHGVLVFDPAKLKFPGDLLHEAGHLAVKSPVERR